MAIFRTTLGTGRINAAHLPDELRAVCDGGAWTLFISWRWRGVWGFLVDGRKVPWREYLRIK